MNMLPKQQPRLLIFHTECVHLRGGEKYIYELTKRISKKRPVVLFVEDISDYWKEKYTSCHISIHKLWKPKHAYWALLPISFMINMLVSKKRVTPSDIIFATNFPVNLLASFLSKKTIMFCFEPLSIFYDQFRIQSASFKERIFLLVEKFMYEPFDHLAIHRAQTLATLNSTVGASVTYRYQRTPDIFIPNGVDMNFFSPTAHPSISNSQKKLFVLGHSTDYTILKGTELLLRALPLVVKLYPSVRLVISDSVPNITMQEHYKKFIHTLQIQKYVRFVGRIPENKLPNLYTSCDVFCYCGSTRCVGGSSASLSVIEAASCGIPVLRTKGNTDEIIDGKTGLYFPLETPNSIAQTILTYIKLSKKEKYRMKQQARKHATTIFSWDSSTKILEKLFV